MRVIPGVNVIERKQRYVTITGTRDYYSPSGAAAMALFDAVFNGRPSYAALLTMAVYTVMFGFIAIRSFRWE